MTDARAPEASAPVDSGQALEPQRFLVDNALWQPVEEANDPFAQAKAERVPCTPTEWGLEELDNVAVAPSQTAVAPAFEVHTDVCNYITVEQPLLAPVRAGDAITALFWHTQLTATEGQGYTALAMDGVVVWEETIALPEVSRARPIRVTAERDFTEGATVRFHVDNHGQNTWNLADLVATSP